MHPSPWQLLSYPVLFVLGLLLPGHLLMRALRLRTGMLESFIGSGALLFNLVLLLQVCGLGLSRGTLLTAMLLLSLGLYVLGSRRTTSPVAEAGPTTVLAKGGGAWLLPVALALVAISIRAVVDPLSGYDQLFRWDHIARMAMDRGNIDFYPPVTAADYTVYGWFDAIPPLASLLDLWCYLSLGAAHPLATAPRILLETVVLMAAIRRLAMLIDGRDEAGNAAMAVAACSPLLLWSLSIGQETGLIAIGLCALCAFLFDSSDDGAVIKAGLAAGMAGCCREYGLGVTLLGLGLLVIQRRSLRATTCFLVISLSVCAPWYLRNWALTGNPLWPHPFFGLFPTHPLYHEFTQHSARLFGPMRDPAALVGMLLRLAVGGGFLLMLALTGALRRNARARLLLCFLACSVAIWWSSIEMTLGGWEYSKRVLAPALALGAALAGAWLGLRSARASRIWASVLLLAATDSALRSFHLPTNVLVSPTQYLSSDWLEWNRNFHRAYSDQVWNRIAVAARGRGIASDETNALAVLASLGTEANAILSPRMHFLFEEQRSFEDQSALLRATGIRFLLLQEPNPLTELTGQRHHFFGDFTRRFEPNARFYGVRVFDLDKPIPTQQGP